MNHDEPSADPSRRDFLKKSFLSLGLLLGGRHLVACGGEDGAPLPPLPTSTNFGALGPLGAPDANGVRLPAGFTSRILAKSGEAIGPDGTPWIGFPDGAATFFARDGGFYYAVNSEGIVDGGVSVLRFDASGTIVDHYPILRKTRMNCSGGKMPWGTWMSCEEAGDGGVFECDPTGRREATPWPALGKFQHEAVAYDPANHHLYLTEDNTMGRFYRFRPDRLVDGHADFASGTLEVLRILVGEEGACEWLPIADPSGSPTATRSQQPTSTAFSGGEGVYHHEGIVYFTTKGDNRIRAYDIANQSLTIVYDQATHPTGTLSGVDNVIATPFGELVVAEDGGDMEIVAVMPNGSLVTLAQVVGHTGSEITGIAFDPTYTRLLFGSQRGTDGKGVSFMIEGPFFAFA